MNDGFRLMAALVIVAAVGFLVAFEFYRCWRSSRDQSAKKGRVDRHG